MPIHKLIIFDRPVETTVISTPDELRSALPTLLSTAIHATLSSVALGIEQAREEEIDVLKLATDTTCLIIQLNRFTCESLPCELHRLFQLPDISFVGVGIKHSVEALKRVYKLRCRNAFDLGSLAASIKKDERLRAYGLVDLAYWVCKVEDAADKCTDAALSDWGAVELSDEQINCATTDAFLAYYVGKFLLRGCPNGITSALD